MKERLGICLAVSAQPKNTAAKTSSKVQLLSENSMHGIRPGVTLRVMDMDKFGTDFCGREGFVVSSPYEPTFVNCYVNGESVIDLCLCNSSVCNLLSGALIDKEFEIVTGAPSVGHWLICYEFHIRDHQIF